MKIGDLVKIKDMPGSDYVIILSINGRFQWADVYWIMIGDSWSFFIEDLEPVNESG